MADADPKAVVRRWLEEVVSTGDLSRVEELVAPGYEEVHEGRRYRLGVDGAREHVVGVRRTYPDLRVTVERQIAEGEWVATVITARGTHAGDWAGIPRTGKVLSFTGVNVDRVVDGRIVEHGGAANLLGPLLESGAVRPAVDPGPGAP